MMQRLLASRCYFGLGDWIMLQSVLKAVNRCHPDLAIDLDVTRVPFWFQMLTISFDARVALVHDPDISAYRYVSGHVVYKSHHPAHADGRPMHLINSMLEQIQDRTGLALSWDGSLANYVGKVEQIPLPERYVVVPSRGAANNPQKDWPLDKFQQLVAQLGQHIDVVQVGRGDDPVLGLATQRWTDLTPMRLQTILSNASAIVSLQNGLSHWAGHLGKPTVTLYTYTPEAMPVHAGYPNQHPLVGECLSVDTVFQKVMSILNTPVKQTCRFDQAEQHIL
jgi:ADP-heptose:LPS heptosyltransferase